MSYLMIPMTMMSDYDIDDPFFDADDYEFMQDLVQPIDLNADAE
jgi:hypothetical protein